MKIALAILAILLVIGLLLGSSFVSRRNQMAIKREAVNAAWSQVDVVLQRRADLIPNLVETVKGYAAQEVTVFGDIAKARSALLSASTPTDKIAANQRLDSALGRLLVVVENYPQLKSNENFLRLQDELAGTENRIAVERRRYNETLQDYNTYISLFPNNLVASMSGFARNDAYFKADEGARQVPKVNFEKQKAPPAPAQAPAPAPAKP
jgi:LemA protein